MAERLIDGNAHGCQTVGEGKGAGRFAAEFFTGFPESRQVRIVGVFRKIGGYGHCEFKVVRGKEEEGE